MKHKHAELMALYAKDAMETDKPWERWERHSISTVWITLVGHPNWHTTTQYRRKPRTININGFDVHEPVREPLIGGSIYYAAQPSSVSENGDAVRLQWIGNFVDKILLQKGLIHLTKEAAETHAKALLSFTQTQP